MSDLKYALRMLLKSPGFSFVAIATLALGIGANTAIFSVLDAVVLNPLPFNEPARLMAVWETNEQPGAPANYRNEVAKGNFADWRARNHVFADIAALSFDDFNLTGTAGAERVLGATVTANFFQVLGVQPSLGRTFLATEENPSSPRVAMMSHALWQRRYGGDPSVIGRQVEINGELFLIAGVMPASFELQFPAALNPELWTPIRQGKSDSDRVSHFLYVIARLKPGLSLAQARADMQVIAGALRREHPDTNAACGVNIIPLQEQIVGGAQRYLVLLFVAVGFVLLIACANVANLFLTRVNDRTREFAIRLAVGAGRTRLVRQLLTESLLVALFGGVLGMLLASYAIDLLRRFGPADLPRLSAVHLNFTALIWTALILIFTAAVCGLGPALQASNPNVNELLQQSGRISGGPRQNRFRRLLVISEIALALLLFDGAGLLIKSLINLQNVNPGFREENLLTLNVALPHQRYKTPAGTNAFYDQLLERLRLLPGVEACGGVDPLPMSGSDGTTGVLVQGGAILPPADRPQSGERLVTPQYFRAMGIPLKRGRDFTGNDREDTPRVVIVNEDFAQRFFPGVEALGKRVGLEEDDGIHWSEIVGVMGNIKHRRLDAEITPELFEPYQQHMRRFMSIVVRSNVAPANLVPAIRAEAARLDHDIPLFAITTMKAQIAQTLAQGRFTTSAFSAFAVLAGILAAIGIYGLLAHFVTQRRKEIGIRVALGARPGHVLRVVLGESLTLLALGLTIGFGAALAVTRLMRALLYGVGTADLSTSAIVLLLLAGAALLASYIPARRALRINPIETLRYE